MLNRWKKSDEPKSPVLGDLFAQAIRIEKNDVIVIRSNELNAMPDEGFADFIASLHEHFPESLVILMDTDSTFETQPIETIREMLEDLIAHQEALDQKGSS